jgi:hypothetical protein
LATFALLVGFLSQLKHTKSEGSSSSTFPCNVHHVSARADCILCPQSHASTQPLSHVADNVTFIFRSKITRIRYFLFKIGASLGGREIESRCKVACVLSRPCKISTPPLKSLQLKSTCYFQNSFSGALAFWHSA